MPDAIPARLRSAQELQAARDRMVDGQIRPNKVTDRRILDAMRRLPRERFLPPDVAEGAALPLVYADADLPLGEGRVLMQPLVIARLLQLALPRAGERALVVGCGTGYGAAVLAACGPHVTALEENAVLAQTARRMLAETAPEVEVVAGSLAAGWQAGAPYDLIVIEGAVTAIPPALAPQVAPVGGRLVTVLVAGEGTHGGQAVLAEPSQGKLRPHAEFDCATALLPTLRVPARFVF
jgi:protein-L-isoaspartate(D-aspartate) O-methyltransferase